MKLNFKENLITLDSTPFINEDETPMTLKNVSLLALTGIHSSDDKRTTKEKIEIYTLARKVANEEELNIEEIALLKERISLIYVSPVIVGRALDIIEGNA